MTNGGACEEPTRIHPEGRTGTDAGYQVHLKRGESPCPACLAARRSVRHPSQTPEYRQQYRASHYAANRESYAQRNLLYKHNLTQAQYDALLESQGGGCALCGATEPKGRGGRRFHVDHDHACCPTATSCGRCVRGLLCGNCNPGLGAFKDDPGLLIRAAEYVMAHRGGQPWTSTVKDANSVS